MLGRTNRLTEGCNEFAQPTQLSASSLWGKRRQTVGTATGDSFPEVSIG